MVIINGPGARKASKRNVAENWNNRLAVSLWTRVACTAARRSLKSCRQQGVRVPEKTVARIMKELGLKSRTVKKYKATTNSNHNLPVHDNVLNQQFRAQAPNQVWMADITYVPTDEGWLYVASVMDLYTRKIVGWHADERMTKELVLQALDQAYNRQRPKGEVLHHSDRGSQYASHEYQKRLLKYGMKCSMSRKGNCYDNACIESFHSVLKKGTRLSGEVQNPQGSPKSDF
ncbi:IS3 family transposase [Paenibacillus sp. 3LSP]|uniref:IS3 family transposase n=1 Tax=Paenibacillus sp. 3LSP TaxID=2800795 RepID=UPI0028FD4BDF|nr:IS3 family transposase [Paenibacillus sp. 3LSP]MDU0332282.1 IS3 family transposase [Paenibacillus sp. 3LSP]